MAVVSWTEGVVAFDQLDEQNNGGAGQSDTSINITVEPGQEIELVVVRTDTPTEACLVELLKSDSTRTASKAIDGVFLTSTETVWVFRVSGGNVYKIKIINADQTPVDIVKADIFLHSTDGRLPIVT